MAEKRKNIYDGKGRPTTKEEKKQDSAYLAGNTARSHDHRAVD